MFELVPADFWVVVATGGLYAALVAAIVLALILAVGTDNTRTPHPR